ncbi:hypothetical protein GPJ56_009527 [Histomonas meleagridis]|uniref:uncharacterized protein n=1 Tax=Histomonas meleagridis TaxID=135588 RepID=UPI00355A2EF9|nr:hypothetical protein GPJ56_009527 [Histomonas meleagridis]KAH0802909.1 hypothetical protein GO595_004416 [Histomonas meleagridis]
MQDLYKEDVEYKQDYCDDADTPPYSPPEPTPKKEFEWPKPTKCNIIGFVVCGILIVFFTILFFCSFFIPRSEYLEAKKQNPQLDFLEMATTPLALYWTYYCCLIIFLVSFPFYFYIEFRFSLILFILSILFLAGAFSLGIITPIKIRNDTTVDKAISHQVSYSSYESDINGTINELPYLEIGFTGVSEFKGKGGTTYYYCNPPTFRVNATNASTSYNIPELGDYAWTQINLNATYPEGVEEYVNTFRERYRVFLPEKDQNGRKITWTDISGFKTDSYNSDLRIIGRKKLEGKLSPAVGQTMMAFWAGLGYIYRLIAIPVYRPVINKYNIEINTSVEYIPPESDEFFQIVSLTHCY